MRRSAPMRGLVGLGSRWRAGCRWRRRDPSGDEAAGAGQGAVPVDACRRAGGHRDGVLHRGHPGRGRGRAPRAGRAAVVPARGARVRAGRPRLEDHLERSPGRCGGPARRRRPPGAHGRPGRAGRPAPRRPGRDPGPGGRRRLAGRPRHQAPAAGLRRPGGRQPGRPRPDRPWLPAADGGAAYHRSRLEQGSQRRPGPLQGRVAGRGGRGHAPVPWSCSGGSSEPVPGSGPSRPGPRRTAAGWSTRS